MQHIFLTLDFPPDSGGVARYYANLLKYWPEPVLVVAPLRQGALKEDDSDSITISRMQMLSDHFWPRWIPLFGIINKLRKTYPASIFHVGQALPIGLAVLFFHKLFGVQYAVYTHGLDMYLGLQSFRKKLFTGLVLRNASAVIANSEYTATLISRYSVLPQKVIVATPGYTPFHTEVESNTKDIVKKQFGITKGPVLLSTARLVYRKGIDIVIRSLAQLIDEYPSIQYVVVGEGPELQALQRLVFELKLQNHVIFTSTISDSQLHSLYSVCDLFVLVPREIQKKGDIEGFGIVYLEANFFGKAVVGSRTGGVAEAVADQVSGVLVDQENVDALTQTISLLLRDSGLRNRLGVAGKERVFKDFVWKDRTIAVYKHIQNMVKKS